MYDNGTERQRWWLKEAVAYLETALIYARATGNLHAETHGLCALARTVLEKMGGGVGSAGADSEQSSYNPAA